MSGAIKLTQAGRRLRIASPLGADTLILRGLSVREAIGRPFSIGADLVSIEEDIKPGALLGKPVTCTVDVGHAAPRHFHGIVREFARTGAYGRGLTAYRLEAVPRMWNLGRTSDCRIFQDKSVADIAGTVFGEHGVAPARFASGMPRDKRVYCVQFNETDLEFVQRLLDEVGAGYFFEHKENDHALVICGANSDYPLVGGDPQTVRPHSDVHAALTTWQPLGALQPGKVHARDFDQLKPAAPLESRAASILGIAGSSELELFFWPSGRADRPDGDPAKLAMEAAEASADVVHAGGNDPAMCAGSRLKVMGGLDAKQAGTWLITAVSHDAYDETHLVDGGSAQYRNSLTLIPADRTWRPSWTRPRPAMPGVHSAIVTGPSGEEIHCDEYGRVKVHFHWDRGGKRDDSSTCWIRVAQGFAGRWGGSWMLPRVGDEVLVAFVDGDVDRPVVIGSVYNAEQKPIYALPANKTQSGIKTRSSKGGGASNFNELRFEDKKGAEEINVQAEKDVQILVKNDRTERIKHNRTEFVENDHTERVTNNRSATIERGNETRLVEKGNISEKASMGKIEVEAMQSITLKCGSSKITMTPAEITVESVQIKIKGQAMLQSEAPMAEHKGTGMMTIKGGIVLIN
jgi:type VI secretion system secreted protein VgrG